MPTIDHSHEAKFCEGESCRALKVWREKCRELKQRLDIAEKAALACPRPLVWKDEPPNCPGLFLCKHVKSKSIVSMMFSKHMDQDEYGYWSQLGWIVPTKQDGLLWAGPVPEPKNAVEDTA